MKGTALGVPFAYQLKRLFPLGEAKRMLRGMIGDDVKTERNNGKCAPAGRGQNDAGKKNVRVDFYRFYANLSLKLLSVDGMRGPRYV